MCDENESPCDITKQQKEQPRGPRSMGLPNAQYRLKIAKFNTQDVPIAWGLTLHQAKDIREKICTMIKAIHGEVMGRPSVSIDLRMPVYKKGGEAKPGDIVLRQLDQVLKAKSTGLEYLISTHIAGVALGPGRKANTLSVLDRTGSIEVKKGYFVFPRAQFDGFDVFQNLEDRDQNHANTGYWGVPSGSYGSPFDLQHAIRQFLRPEAMSEVDILAVARAIDSTEEAVRQALAQGNSPWKEGSAR